MPGARGPVLRSARKRPFALDADRGREGGKQMTDAGSAGRKRVLLWTVGLAVVLAVPVFSSAQEGPRPGLVPPPGSNLVTIGPGSRYAGDVVTSGWYWI